MATYTGIKGFKVQSLASDPSTDIEGQIWYNTTSGALKYTGPGTGAWTTGGNMATSRTRAANGGTQSASFVGGGGAQEIPRLLKNMMEALGAPEEQFL
mgnify:CR=1 FL=1